MTTPSSAPAEKPGERVATGPVRITPVPFDVKLGLLNWYLPQEPPQETADDL